MDTNRPVRVALVFLLVAGSVACQTTQVKIITWNAMALMKPSDVVKRSQDIKRLVKEQRPDILLLQEVTSYDVVDEVRDVMGGGDVFPHIACSNFEPSDEPKHTNFEVAIISKFPLSQVIEYDPKLDRNKGQNDPVEARLEPTPEIKINEVRASRGYLWAMLADIKLTVAVLHLKSSLGESGQDDLEHAKKREAVMAGVARGVKEDMGLFPGYTFLVAGDFNVGHGDTKKNGTDFGEDETEPGSGDLYDETHAMLSAGILYGLSMTNLVAHITSSTLTTHSGTPIDNIYVDGNQKGNFAQAVAASKTYGSDHVPVSTVFSFAQ